MTGNEPEYTQIDRSTEEEQNIIWALKGSGGNREKEVY